VRTISVEELKARLDSGEQVHLVDCREPSEYAEFNLNGILIPLGKIQVMEIEPIEDLKESEIIIHCRSGQRSMMAALFLEAVGFKNVVNVHGGVLDWQEKFGPTKP
jgi:rhodanese-related sulfurtransferase